ncbi:non-ribosomal peptide synthetase [Pseudoalteromonas aliena]|uniref:Non-ribosomal peptide synthetase n=3 Tax=Pseudoalteromonas TaxID=53246 RepID=A0A1Q2H148_9GAMM|nr:non-ribosomal peptide synthetase [Pseudoalteromonas aliena]AQQ01011.1 non-ribosomal peptide synthetase [Pseudoalteromonas aliena]
MNVNQALDLAVSQGVHLYVEEGKLKFKATKGSMPNKLKSVLKENKVELIALLSELQTKSHISKNIIPSGHQIITELSFSQQRLWFLEQLRGPSAEYNIPLALDVHGELSIKTVESVFNDIIERHTILRSFYYESDQGIRQQIRQYTDFKVNIIDLSDCQDKYATAERHIYADANTAFNLTEDLLFRVTYILIEKGDTEKENQGVLLLNMHHITSDGWSMEVLISEFITAYEAQISGRGYQLPELEIQYTDYAHWQRTHLTQQALAKQIQYWQQKLADIPALHGITPDFERPSEKCLQGNIVRTNLRSIVAENLKKLAKNLQLTPFMLIHGALALVLARHSNSNDIVIGTPIANRNLPELEMLIGYFANTLVLCADTKQTDINEYLKHIKVVHQQAQANQDVPFEQLVEKLNIPRSSAHSPIFQVMLTINSDYGIRDNNVELQGLTINQRAASTVAIKYDLEIEVVMSDQGVKIEWNYDCALFKKSRVTAFSEHLESVLQYLAELSPQHLSDSLSSLPILSEQERKQQLDSWNDTRVEYPKELCIHELFEAQAAANPTDTALHFGEQTLSYGELNAKANQLAHYLRDNHHVGPESLVGLCVERSLEMVIGIWGILKAGGAYVPLDPELPSARLQYLVNDANTHVVLSVKAVTEYVELSSATVVLLDQLGSVSEHQFSTYSETNIIPSEIGLNAHNLAYMIYTSGSTGNPKGVLIEHQALHNRIDWMDREYGCDSSDKILQKTPYSFDVSVWEFVWPMLKGAQLVISKPEGHKDPSYLTELIIETGITKLHFVPSMLGVMLEHGDLGRCESIKHVFCSGEALQINHVTQFNECLPKAGLHNLYGPTEAAIDVSYWDCSQAHGSSIPIGKPIQNIQLYILDDEANLLPQGACGELHIGGDGLARGYLNRPALTEERFITNPFYNEGKFGSSARLYKTGDLVRYDSNGNIEYMGRLDHQVKIRGFRIELGEIEYQIAEHEQIDSAQVVAVTDKSGNQRLLAYAKTVVEGTSEVELIASLKQALGSELPEYMLPSRFILLSQWPQTANGKIDRKALPALDDILGTTVYIAPNGEQEEELVATCAELLNIDIQEISITANFFELGGHSLMIMELVSRLKKRGFITSVQALFEAKVLKNMAESLVRKDNVKDEALLPENLIPYKCQYLTPEMINLASVSQHDLNAISAAVPGGTQNIQDIYPLAPLQESIFLIHCATEGTDPYVTMITLEFATKVAIDKFVARFNKVIKRHDILRTLVSWRGRSEPLQVVLRDVTLTPNWLPFSGQKNIKELLNQYIEQGEHRLDLEQAPLLQLELAYDTQVDKYFAVLKEHHLLLDHISVEMIMHELALEDNEHDQLPTALPYRNFIAQTLLRTEKLDIDTFFTNKLGDINIPCQPFGLSNTTGNGIQSNELDVELSVTQSQQIRALMKQQGSSPAAFFHLAWAMVIAACSQTKDVVFGTVLSGRMSGLQDIERMMGMMINTLPLRINLAEHDASALIQKINLELLELIPFEQVSLTQAQACSGVPGQTPLFSAIFNYRHSKLGKAPSSGETQAIEAIEKTNYPFNLCVDDWGQLFSCNLQIDNEIAIESVAGYVTTAIDRLLNALSNNTGEPVAGLSVLPNQEQQQLLAPTLNDYVKNDKLLCIHELFELQAAKHPDNIAIVFDNKTISYKTLNEQANQLAHHLLENFNIEPDALIGLCINRSPNMIVGILAILKAGGAYVPLDPNYPQERLNFICEDASLGLVLTEGALSESLVLGVTQTLNLESAKLQAKLATHSIRNLDNKLLALTASNLAYVIYTSGSTGKPKGVLQTHKNVSRLFDVTQPDFNFTAQDCWCLFHSFAFDFSVWEIWGAFFYGGKLIVPTFDEVKDTNLFVSLCRKEGLTVLNQTPSSFKQLTEYLAFNKQSLSALRTIVFGGEGLVDSHLTLWWQNFSDHPAKLINMYGITETTVHVTYKQILQDSDISIGKPLRDQQILLLDGAMNLVPNGCVGEIYVAGAGLARGYLNREILSAEKFIPNPYYSKECAWLGDRLYRTGDLAKYDTMGELHYFGRQDDQVKIRGHRIELGEVENRITQLEQVDSALVLALPDAQGSLQLVAYIKVIPMLIDTDWQTELKLILNKQLLAYMIPKVIVPVVKWPLTNNGKVDKKGLPEIETGLFQADYEAPTTTTELKLTEIWSQLLHVASDKIGINVNFFELGGHSLLLMKLLAEISEKLNSELTVKDIFSAATVKLQAEKIDIKMGGVTRPAMAPLTHQRGALLTLSYAQQRLWFIDQLNGGSPEYNMPVVFDVVGNLDLDSVEAALNRLIERHEVLRTVYLSQNEGPKQQILDDFDFNLTLHDLSELDENSKQHRLTNILKEDGLLTFKLDSDLMLRACYVLLNYAQDSTEQKGVLMFNVHHIASDGWSIELMSNEFIKLYQSLTMGIVEPLNPLTLQYSDYAAWQRDWLSGELLEEQLDYWRKKLTEVPAVHGLKLDKLRPEEKQFSAEFWRSSLLGEVSGQIRELAESASVTPFMLVHSALAYVLSKHSNSHDIVIGTPVANRSQSEVAPLVGYFANTLVLRVNTEHDGIDDYLEHVKAVHIDAQSNQDVPFEQLVDVLRTSRTTAYSPIFQIMLTINSDFSIANKQQVVTPNLSFTTRLPETTTTKFDLEINIELDDSEFHVNWTYDRELFNQAHIKVIAQHLESVLQYLAELSPQHLSDSLSSLPILSEQERKQQLDSWNDTRVEYPKELCIHELFEAQAAANPTDTALHFGEQTLSYGELNAKANQLAHYLRDNHHVGPESLVGLCVERSLEMVIGIWGILKAGGAYVPLDPELPSARLQYLVNDANTHVVLSVKAVTEYVELSSATVVLLDQLGSVSEHQFSTYSETNIIPSEIGLNAHNLAYMIYTSGSTGNPKGVLIEHQALHNRIDWMDREYGCDSSDKILQKTPYSFDVSVWEFVWPMLKGAQLVISKPEGHKDPSYLTELIIETGITKLHFVPSMLGVMLEHGDLGRCESIKHVFCSGEALQINHVTQFNECLPKAGLHNLYGPTEAAIDVSYWDCSQAHGSSIPIGKPIQNIQLYILDDEANLLPQGACGELHIGGDGLARGYLNRPALTEERFITNPFYNEAKLGSSARLYKTGDLVRYDSNGNIEYMGRLDHQVKIRGFRIELGEIEYQIAEHEQIDSAQVVAVTDKSGNQRLLAYAKTVVEGTSEVELIASLKQALGSELPEYMIPSRFILLSQWPQTANGKIDRKALPVSEEVDISGEYVAPQGETELILTEVWAHVLKLPSDKISRNANFFELGGHSLLVIKVMKAIELQFVVPINIKHLFKYSSVEELAGQIDLLIAKQDLKIKLEQSDNVERIVF